MDVTTLNKSLEKNWASKSIKNGKICWLQQIQNLPWTSRLEKQSIKLIKLKEHFVSISDWKIKWLDQGLDAPKK